MSKPNAKQVADALRCSAFGGGVPCCECYFLRIEDGHKVCSSGGIEEDAADLIEAQAARIRELEDSARVAHSHWLVEPVVIGVFDGEKLTCFNPKCRRYYGTVTYGERPDYCPHCGARMDGGAV